MADTVDFDDEGFELLPRPSQWRLRILMCVTVVLAFGGLACIKWAFALYHEQCTRRFPAEDDPVLAAAGGGFALGMVAVICMIVWDIKARINAPHQKV